MQKVIALVRVSTEEQAQEGLSGIERQWRDIEAICRRENLHIERRYQLEGISGSTVKLNPQFQQMLKAVTGPEIAGLVISSPDRLMRCNDLSDLAILAPFGAEANPRLIWTAESVYNLRKLDGQLMFLMQTLVGGHEKKQIVKRIADGNNISRERGDKCADKPPAGVEFVVTDPKNRTGFYRYTPEAQRIKRAFHRMLDRDTSVSGLAKELGFPSYQMLKKQLQNPVWIGYRLSPDAREKLPPGPNGELRHRRIPRPTPIRAKMNLQGEPLISEDVFNEVQGILTQIRKETLTRRIRSGTFLLANLLRCPCGQKYYVKHYVKREIGFYICKTRYQNAKEGCGYANLPRQSADARVIAFVASTLASKEILMEMVNAALVPRDLSELREERDQLRSRIEIVSGKRTKLIDRIAEGIVTEEEARVSLAKIRSEIESGNARLDEIERKMQGAKISDVAEVVNRTVSFVRRIKIWPQQKQREILLKVIQEIQIGPSKEIRSITLKGDHAGITIMCQPHNPCPCGFYGDPTRECRCTPGIIQRYLAKVSGPLLDRIDLHIEVPAVAYKELRSKADGASSAEIRERVERSRDVQRQRGFYNAEIPHSQLRSLCSLDNAGEKALEMAVRKMSLSARAHDRILKVARTIADLDQSASVTSKHLAEAVQYRNLDRNYWN